MIDFQTFPLIKNVHLNTFYSFCLSNFYYPPLLSLNSSDVLASFHLFPLCLSPPFSINFDLPFIISILIPFPSSKSLSLVITLCSLSGWHLFLTHASFPFSFVLPTSFVYLSDQRPNFGTLNVFLFEFFLACKSTQCLHFILLSGPDLLCNGIPIRRKETILDFVYPSVSNLTRRVCVSVGVCLITGHHFFKFFGCLVSDIL